MRTGLGKTKQNCTINPKVNNNPKKRPMADNKGTRKENK